MTEKLFVVVEKMEVVLERLEFVASVVERLEFVAVVVESFVSRTRTTRKAQQWREELPEKE